MAVSAAQHQQSYKRRKQTKLFRRPASTRLIYETQDSSARQPHKSLIRGYDNASDAN